MKPFIITLSLVAASALTSCLNTQSQSSVPTGQNRFGYNGTTSTFRQPTMGSTQGTVTDPVNTTGTTGTGITQSQPSMAGQTSGADTIAIDRLPTNNSSATTSSTAASSTNGSNSGSTATTDTTSSDTSGNTAAVTDDKPKKQEYLYGIPVPGRDGMVFSPYNKDAGYIDVRHMKPGALAEDPYTPGKLFRVP